MIAKQIKINQGKKNTLHALSYFVFIGTRYDLIDTGIGTGLTEKRKSRLRVTHLFCS